MRGMAKELTVQQFADILNVSRDMVARWVRDGKVKARRKNPFAGRTSAYLIPESEVERVKKAMNEPAKHKA